jgi:hypothetical protein
MRSVAVSAAAAPPVGGGARVGDVALLVPGAATGPTSEAVWSSRAWPGGGESAESTAGGWEGPLSTGGRGFDCARGGSARASADPRTRRGERGVICAWLRGSTAARRSTVARSTAVASGSPPERDDSALAEPGVELPEVTTGEESGEKPATVLAASCVGFEARRFGVLSHVPISATTSTPTTTPTTPPMRKGKRRSGTLRVLPTSRRHLRNCSSRSRSSDSGSSLSVINTFPAFDAAAMLAVRPRSECQKHNRRCDQFVTRFLARPRSLSSSYYS